MRTLQNRARQGRATYLSALTMTHVRRPLTYAKTRAKTCVKGGRGLSIQPQFVSFGVCRSIISVITLVAHVPALSAQRHTQSRADSQSGTCEHRDACEEQGLMEMHGCPRHQHHLTHQVSRLNASLRPLDPCLRFSSDLIKIPALCRCGKLSRLA